MGYRSQVRSLIYGDPDQICALVAAHTLSAEVNAFKCFDKDITRYRMTRRTYDHEATAAQKPDGIGARKPIWRDDVIEVVDLYGDAWKWYGSYPDVQAWELLLQEAQERGLSTEFVRIGEDYNDIDIQQNIQDDGDSYINVSSSIVDDLPDERTPVDYNVELAAQLAG